MRSPILRASFIDPSELVVDNFAGGGGASTGIEEAIGRPVDIAINHSPEAIAMHKANHPNTRHFCENIWEVDPKEACGDRPVGLAKYSRESSFWRTSRSFSHGDHCSQTGFRIAKRPGRRSRSGSPNFLDSGTTFHFARSLQPTTEHRQLEGVYSSLLAGMVLTWHGRTRRTERAEKLAGFRLPKL